MNLWQFALVHGKTVMKDMLKKTKVWEIKKRPGPGEKQPKLLFFVDYWLVEFRIRFPAYLASLKSETGWRRWCN